jgi:type I restriction enzyme S subunit
VFSRFRSHLDFAVRAVATRPVRLRHLVQFVTSGSRGWGEYYADAGPRFLRIGDLSHDDPFISLEECGHVDPPPGVEGFRTSVRPGDVLVGITADIGAVGLASSSIGIAYVSQHVCLIRPRPEVISEWLAWALLTSDAQQQLRLMSYGGTKVGLGLGDVRSLILAYPSTSDQVKVAREVAAESIRAQGLRRHCEAQVSLLQERRQALITAAVTGQLRISEAA